MNYTVIGKKWFEKTNGNTYHSVIVYKDGQEIGKEAFDYGYGNQWEFCGLNIIKKDDPTIKATSLWHIKELGHTLVTNCTDVQRKKDL